MTIRLPQNMLGKLRENMHEYGLGQTLERSGLWITERILAPALHRHLRPSLSAFEEAAVSMHFSAEELAGAYLLPASKQAELDVIRSEHESLRQEIRQRYARLSGAYPQHYSLEEGSSFLVYALVRLLRPSVILETGVANGHSSFYILSALLANGHGLLHSIDRSPQVGGLLSGREHRIWRLHVLKLSDLKRSFLQILEALPPVDCFLHDSDHSYPWQSFELNAVMKKLTPEAVLAFDDCDSCFAFIDHCQALGVRPVVLVEKRKVFGLVFREQQAGIGSDIRKAQESAVGM
jgi:predicted O-methyltransferase YrrM